MFDNLFAEMGRKRIAPNQLSKLTGIPYGTLSDKLKKKTDFKLPEMLAIQKVFPGCSLEYLFGGDNDTANH